MSSNLPRRAFLSGLVRLPLIGGGVSLIGQPTGAAEPITLDLMQAYKTWLHYEHRCLAWEMANHPEMVCYYGGTQTQRYHYIEPMTMLIDIGEASNWHHPSGGGRLPPSTRAALVMSTVGCDWREPESRRSPRLIDLPRAKTR